MKLPYLILPFVLSSTLSGCVNLEFPGLVADTAKVSKDAYSAIVGSDEDKKESVADTNEYISNSYIGQESQAVSDIKQQCVNEAAEKLSKIAGKEVRYTVVENKIASVNDTIVANCKLVIDKSAADTPVAQQ